MRGLKENSRCFYKQRLKDGNALRCTASFGCMECRVLWWHCAGCHGGMQKVVIQGLLLNMPDL